MKSHFTSKIQMNVEIVSFIVTFYVSQPSFTSNMKKKRKKRETQSVTVENETVQDEMHDIILLQLNSETDGFQRERTSAEAQLKQVRLWNRRIPTINLLSFSTDRQTWATVPSPSMLHSFAQSLDLTAPWPFCRQLRPKPRNLDSSNSATTSTPVNRHIPEVPLARKQQHYATITSNVLEILDGNTMAPALKQGLADNELQIQSKCVANGSREFVARQTLSWLIAKRKWSRSKWTF